MNFQCSLGHDSSEGDYCSVCGAPIKSRNTRAAGEASVCPDCGEPREANAHFCEVCRFDFVSNKPAVVPLGNEAQTLPGKPASRRADPPTAAGWKLVITVDPSLDTEPESLVKPDVGLPPRTVVVERPELLIGRLDELRDIRPDIAVDDPGISRRHAKIVMDGSGALTIQDLASTNGTQLNNVEMPPGSKGTLSDGDAITLGRWTRIVVRRAL